MPNPHRGEIEARLDGRPYTLCLTLGALAELEHAFGHEDMLALAERFQRGRLSARDAQRVIAAGLRGAGHDIADDAVARMKAEGGASGYVDIVARLLSATFGGASPVPDGATPSASDIVAVSTEAPSPPKPRAQPEPIRDLSAEKERVSPVPFPGRTQCPPA
jgi:hypothetical protein